MPKQGDILHYENFEFYDGNIRNKFFVVLTENPVLCLITTSKNLRYPMVDHLGCHPEKFTFFIPVSSHNVFSRPTFLVMQKIYEFTSPEISKKIENNQIVVKEPLPNQLLMSVLECLKHFREDIADVHWDSIFSTNTPSKNSLEALAKKFNRHKKRR